jgi:hypothetical protein
MISIPYSVIYIICLTAWILVALFTTIYMQKGLDRSDATYNSLKDVPNKVIEKLIALRRMQREKTLVRVEQLMFFAGVIAVILFFIPTDAGLIRDIIRAFLPISLVAAHVYLGLHTLYIHTHHHELMNKITAETLRKQLEERQASKVKDVVITQVDEHQIAVAVMQKEGEENGPTNTTVRTDLG